MDGGYKEYKADNDIVDSAIGKNYIASVSENKQVIQVRRQHLQKLLWTKTLKNDSPRMPAISPNGKILAVPTLQEHVYFWDLKTGHLLSRTHCSTGVLRCLAFSPNGRVLAASGGYRGDSDGIRLLDLKSYKVFAVLKAAFPENYDGSQKDWTLSYPDWFASLPDLSYIASDSVIKKIRTPGRARDPEIIRRFNRPERVRAALRKCYKP